MGILGKQGVCKRYVGDTEKYLLDCLLFRIIERPY